MARSFGERFLAEFRRRGGSTAGWPAGAVSTLQRADRTRFVALLVNRRSQMSSELTIAAHTAEPEALAKRALAMASKSEAQSDLAGQCDLSALAILIAAVTGSAQG